MKKIISLFVSAFLFFAPLSNAAWDDTLPAGTTNISDLDTVIQANNAALEGLLSAPYGAVNLQVSRTSTASVTVTADQLYLQSTSDLGVRQTSVSEVIDITTSGASGLDSGVEAISTWYYIWIIRKSSDGTINGLLSASSSSPTMPSGYDQKALVSAVRNNSSGDFIDFVQRGCQYDYVTGVSAVTGDNSFTLTAIDISSIVPSSLSDVVFGKAEAGAASVAVSNVSSGISSYEAQKVLVGSLSSYGAVQYRFKVLTTNTLYYAGNDASSSMYVNGFIINKLPL